MRDTTKDLSGIVSALSDLTIMETVELVKQLESHWGVSAAAVVAASGSDKASEAPAAKTEFDVVLFKVGIDAKLAAIKEVRSITNLGLKEAKDLVDSIEKGPVVLKQGLSKADAESMKARLQAVGLTVELK